MTLIGMTPLLPPIIRNTEILNLELPWRLSCRSILRSFNSWLIPKQIFEIYRKRTQRTRRNSASLLKGYLAAARYVKKIT